MTSALPVCQVQTLGLTPYRSALALQLHMAGQIASGERPATLLLLEHPPTFTTGRLGKPEHLLWDDAELARRRIEVHTTDRGGDFTYHGPGQLVGYPLLPLGKVDHRGHLPKVDYVGYLRRLEQVLIATLADFGLVGLRHQGLTGVWVKSDQAWVKLAAIGVKIDARGISRHGFALNLDPDMTNWQGIVPCGIDQYAVSSVAQQLGQPIPSAAVESSLVGHFGRTFGHQMQTVEAAVLPAA